MNDSRSILRWEEPPDRKRQAGRVDWSVVADDLKAHQGQWAAIYEAKESPHSPAPSETELRRARGLATSIKAANVICFRPQGSFEAVTRMTDTSVTVYARYIGGDS